MKLDNFIVVGISHLEHDTIGRERFISKKPEKFINSLYKSGIIKGYISLITCLRAEFYIELQKYSLEDFIKLQEFKDFFSEENIFTKKGYDALEYFFKVTCGFYSVIKGEDQILAQIKKAYQDSFDKKVSSKFLNVIFNKGIELGKKFRTESQICHNALSLEAISLKLIKNSIDSIKNKKILILGIGDLAQSILELLLKEEIGDITITNRTKHRALEIKNIYHSVNVIGFEEKNEEIIKSDIIISATSAPHLVIKKEKIGKQLSMDKEYIFLDLAVPRDIDDEIKKYKNVKLFNLDDIWKIYNDHVKNREDILTKYEFLIFEQIENLNKWIYWKNKSKEE